MCVRFYLLLLCVVNVQFLQLCVRSRPTCQNTNNRDHKIYSAFIGTSFVRLLYNNVQARNSVSAGTEHSNVIHVIIIYVSYVLYFFLATTSW